MRDLSISDLTYPFTPKSFGWYLVESTSWSCSTGSGCGACDACFWDEQREALRDCNPELYEALWSLHRAYHTMRNLLSTLEKQT
jgi:hypothetical protein